MNGGDKCEMSGRFDVRCLNPDGSVAWEVSFKNGTTTAGLNAILNTMFNGASQTSTWYFGLIDNAAYSSVAASDTISSHSGWSESQDYAEAARQAWTKGTPAGGVINTTAAAAFTMNAAGTLRGAFLVSNSTKGGTSGTLWATGEFGSTQAFTSGQVIQVSYACTATGS